MGIDKRHYARFEAAWPVRAKTDQGTIEGEVRNICPDGALIQCRELPQASSSFLLEIEISEHRYSIFPTVKLIHFEVDESEDSSLSYRVGVKFEKLSSKDRVLLNNAILSRSMKTTR